MMSQPYDNSSLEPFAQVKLRIDRRIRDVCKYQEAIVSEKFKEKTYCERTFRFDKHELPAEDNYFNSSSKVWSLLEIRIPREIQKILHEDEIRKRHVPKIVSFVEDAIAEFLSNFMKRNLERRMLMEGCAPVSPETWMHHNAGQTFAGIGTDNTAYARGYLAVLLCSAAFGSVGLGLFAAVQSISHGLKEYEYHQDKQQYIASLVPRVFAEIYLKQISKTAQQNCSETALYSCIWKMYEDIRNDIDTFFDKRLPDILHEYKDLLRIVYLELLAPNEMEKELGPLVRSHQELMKKFVIYTAENEGMTLNNDEIQIEGPMGHGEFYNSLECIVPSRGSSVHDKMLLRNIQDKQGAMEGEILLSLIACKELRSLNTDIGSILDIKGVMLDADDALKIITIQWEWGLSDYLKTKRTQQQLPTDVLIEVAEDITTGLHFLHSNGLTHRCLTGANVKVTRDGKIKLMYSLTERYFRASAPYHRIERTCTRSYEDDDDLFPLLSESATASYLKYRYGKYSSHSSSRGPKFDEYPILPTHVAPEFIMGKERLYTKEADVYSLGILLWEITYDMRAYVCDTPLKPASTMKEFLNFLHDGGRPRISNPSPLRSKGKPQQGQPILWQQQTKLDPVQPNAKLYRGEGYDDLQKRNRNRSKNRRRQDTKSYQGLPNDNPLSGHCIATHIHDEVTLNFLKEIIEACWLNDPRDRSSVFGVLTSLMELKSTAI